MLPGSWIPQTTYELLIQETLLKGGTGGGGKIDHAKYIFYESHDQDHSILF